MEQPILPPSILLYHGSTNGTITLEISHICTNIKHIHTYRCFTSIILNTMRDMYAHISPNINAMTIYAIQGGMDYDISMYTSVTALTLYRIITKPHPNWQSHLPKCLVALLIHACSGITSIDGLPISLISLYINACHTHYNFDNLPIHLTRLSIQYITTITTHCDMDYLPPYLASITLYSVIVRYWPNNCNYYILKNQPLAK